MTETKYHVRVRETVTMITALTFLILLITHGEGRHFQEHDYLDPGFDPSQLEVVEKFLRPLASCPQEEEEVTVVRYDWIDGHGDIHQDNLTMAYGPHYVEVVQIQDPQATTAPTDMLTIRPHLNCLHQEDPMLIEIIQKEYLSPPPMNQKTMERKRRGNGQDRMLDQRYFHERKKGGFFVEAGAFDGDTDSNTVYFEQEHQWSGLLIEPVPGIYSAMKDKHRTAWTVQTCLSSSQHPETILFSLTRGTNGTMKGGSVEGQSETTRMQCLPLYSLLLSLGNPTIDLLSLDIEGPEYEVLFTLPWDKVDIRAISVETQFLTNSTKERLFSLLLSVGFLHLSSLARDDVFVRLDREGMSPRQSLIELVTRSPRLCQYFRVKRKEIPWHCMTQWPRDYFLSVSLDSVAECVGNTQCVWSIESLIHTLTYSGPWQTTLSHGCLWEDHGVL